MKHTGKPPISIPLHHPLYSTIADYGGDCLGVAILLEADEAGVRRVLEPTPLEYVAPYAWIEAYIYPTTFGMAGYEDSFGDPYGSFGIVVPARFGEHVGGYYAHCFKNKDYGTAPGREAAGFPIKQAALRLQKTGRAVTGAMDRPTARMELSLIIGGKGAAPTYPKAAVRAPNLLIQSIPAVERDEVLLQQIIKRDVSASSDLTAEIGEPAIRFPPAPSGVDELAWLADSTPIYGELFSGLFRGAFGEVLSTTVSSDLAKRIAEKA